ncbi:MAG: hypothetical protein AAGI66_09415 [Cyanobacteria bacterium P01_H01_bin.74]
MKIWSKTILTAATLAVLAVSGIAVAQDMAPYSTFDINIGHTVNSDHVLKVNPVVSHEVNKNMVAFHIFNNTGKEIYFLDAQGSEKQYIPMVSNNTVEANHYPGKVYKVYDLENNLLAQWQIDDAPPVMANVESATQEDFNSWGRKLAQVIENQQVSYQAPMAKAEPHYYNSKPAPSYSQNDMIRGYW